MGVSLISFMVLDLVKVFVIKKWSFELTAKLWPVASRRKELKRRKLKKVENVRIQRNVSRLRKCCLVIAAVYRFKRGING